MGTIAWINKNHTCGILDQNHKKIKIENPEEMLVSKEPEAK